MGLTIFLCLTQTNNETFLYFLMVDVKLGARYLINVVKCFPILCTGLKIMSYFEAFIYTSRTAEGINRRVRRVRISSETIGAV